MNGLITAGCLVVFPKMDIHKYPWEFQDPKMEVLYHIRPYFGRIFAYIGLKNRPKIYGIGTSNQSDPESWPLGFFSKGCLRALNLILSI